MNQRFDDWERQPYLRSCGSFYCAYTLTTYVGHEPPSDSPGADDPHGRYASVHEAFHWASSAFTTSGLFLSALRNARQKMILTYVHLTGADAINEMLRRRAGTSVRSLYAPVPYDRLLSVLDPANESVTPFLHNYLLARLSEHYYLRYFPLTRKAPRVITDIPLQHAVFLAFRTVARELNTRLSGLTSYFALTDREAVDLGREFVSETEDGDHHLFCDTIDLMEAFSVVADICAAVAAGDETRAAVRIEELLTTPHFRGVLLAAMQLWEPLTPRNLFRLAPTLLALLEVALNPPCLPATSLASSLRSFPSVYPPLRFQRALDIARRDGGVMDGSSSAAAIDAYVRHLFKELGDATHVFTARHCVRRPSVFDAMKNSSVAEVFASGITWDALDVQIEAFEHFRAFLTERNLSSLTSAFYSGVYNDYERARPPALLYADSQLRFARYVPPSLAALWLPILGMPFGLDDLVFGDGTLRLTPLDGVPGFRDTSSYRDACEVATVLLRRGLGVDISFA